MYLVLVHGYDEILKKISSRNNTWVTNMFYGVTAGASAAYDQIITFDNLLKKILTLMNLNLK